MIRLEVQPYCDSCLDFEPDVIKPQKIVDSFNCTYVVSDTIIRCEYAKRCENIKRYLKSAKEI